MSGKAAKASARKLAGAAYSGSYLPPCPWTPACPGVLLFEDGNGDGGSILTCSECAEGANGAAALDALANIRAAQRLTP